MGTSAKKIVSRWWPIGIILAVWLAFAYPYWGKGLVPFPSKYLVTFFPPWSNVYGMPVKNNAMPDVITQIYPWKHVTAATWKQGELPLWNPYSFSGTSHVGNYQSAIFSPINALYFVLPEIHAWSVMILLQPLLAGLFMFLFLRSLAISKPGSILGSLAYMFSGFIVVWMAYGTLGYAVLFLPPVLYGIQTKRYVLTAAGVALSFLSGHFQMSVYVLFYAISFALYRKEWTSMFFIALGLGLAAPQVFPAFDSYQAAVRSSIFGKGEVIPWQYLVTIFSPDFYGNPVTRNDWFGHYAEWASFLGVIPLFVALFAAVTKWKDPLVRFLIYMAAFSVSLAFQTPILDLFYALRIPVLGTSSASRIIVLASFSLAVLSGIGLDALIHCWKANTWKNIRWWLGLSALFILFLWVILVLFRPLPAEKLTVAMRNSVLPTAMLGGLLVTSIVGFWLPKRLRLIPVVILLVLTAFDTYRFAAKWMPFDPGEYVYPELPVISKLKELIEKDHSRVFGNIGNEVGSRFGIQLVDGYDALYQYRYGKFISSISTGTPHPVDRSVVTFDKHGKYSEDVLELLGVKYYMHKKSDGRFVWAYPFWEYPQYRLAWEDDNFQILENTKSFPRAFLASSFRVETEDQKILDALYSVNRRDAVILEKEPSTVPEPGKGDVAIELYRPTEVVMNTKADVPKLLFLSDVFDSGWRATIDGNQAELYRANFDFRAVALPAGSHTIRMWYAPRSVTLGFMVGGVSVLGMVGFLVWKKRV